MNCNIARELTDEYLDGLLSDDQKKDFEAHLDTCPECLETVQQMRQMLRFLSSMEEEELPAGFYSRLHERLQAIADEEISASNEVQRFPLQKKWLKWSAGLAAAVGLFLSVRLAAQLGGFTGNKNAMPDTTVEQDASGGLPAQRKLLQESADEPEFTADAASDAAGELAGASEMADTPMMMSAAAPEESAADDTAHAEEQSKTDEGAEKSQPVESDMRMLTAETVLSGEFNLYVSDTTVAYKKISVIAASIGMTIKDETEDSVILLITDEDQRKALYDSLAKLGRVEDLGVFSEDNTVTVHVIFEK